MSMDGRFDLSYLYARLCGSLRSSWLGYRSSDLLKAGKVSDLWRLLFSDSVPALPERKLVAALEARVLSESMESFVELASGLEGAGDFVLRHVEVHADEHALASKIQVFDEQFGHGVIQY